MPSPPSIKLNAIDRAIGFVSPQRAVARLKARMQLAVAGQWLGARTDRRETANWLPWAGSADADSLYDLPNLRTRTRDLQRGNPLALGAVNTAVTSVVGSGLSLRCRIDAAAVGLTDDQAQEWQRSTECEYRMWAEDPRACDAEATLNIYGQQELALRSALDSGDVIATLPMIDIPSKVYSTKVQLVEADRLCNPDSSLDTDRIAGGVEVDANGAPLVYHILKRHPGSFALGSNGGREWDHVPAFGVKSGRRNVVHLFRKQRPGQRRGVPYLAPVIESLRQLGEYSNAELRAALVGSLLTVFVKTEGGQGLGLDSTGAAPTTAPVSGDSIQLGTGAIVDLAPGEDIALVNPTRPNQAFDPFVMALLRQIGSALEIPFEILLKHFTASYSASQAAFLEAWRFFRGRREWMATSFCQPIYEAWLEEAIARGRVVAPGFFDDPFVRAAYCNAEWIGDAPGTIDPEKYVNAAEKRLNLFLTTHADEQVQMNGGVWDDTIARLGREEKMIEKAGLQRPPVTGQATAPYPPNAAPPLEQTAGDEGDPQHPSQEN